MTHEIKVEILLGETWGPAPDIQSTGVVRGFYRWRCETCGKAGNRKSTRWQVESGGKVHVRKAA